jgi:hypothetical protein
MNRFWNWLFSLWRQPDYVTQLPKTLCWPVQPNRGVRQIDAAGDGTFGASRDGGTRKHLGLDLISHSGDNVLAPCMCEVTHIGLAYAGSTLGSLHLKGWDDWGAYTFKLLYVQPEVTVGEILRVGEVIATTQDVAGYYAGRGTKGMTGHVHFEVHTLEGAVNPLDLLERRSLQ